MLTATRDPFHPGAPDASKLRQDGASRLSRTFTIIQVVGSLVAIPIGLASAYSMYRANFSVEASCQNLRGNIVTMLDKSVDATARRMLVRRDVEAFERSCGGVDPDATAAFKALLAAEKEKAVPPASVAAAPAVEAKPKEPARKVEARSEPAVKQPAAKANPVVTAAVPPARRDDPVSDALWLDAVRQALANHKPEPARAAEPAKAESALQAPPAVSAKSQEISAPAPAPAPARIAPVPVPEVATPAAAPALPPPATVTNVTAVPQPDASHPVPPQAIPDSVPPANADAAKPDERSRVRKWIARVPLLGNVVENGLQ